jgi:glycerol-3-phosphate dehydrogenase
VTRDYVLKLEHAAANSPVLSIIGGKITTYRTLAQAVLARLHPLIGGSRIPWTDQRALPGGDMPEGDLPAFVRETQRRWPFLSPATASRLASAYGTRVERVLGAATSPAMLGPRFGPDLWAAEVDYLQRQEWAVTAEDILWRRSKRGLALSAAETRELERYLHQTVAADARWRA